MAKTKEERNAISLEYSRRPEVKAVRKAQYEENKEARLAYIKQYRIDNKDKVMAQNKEYRNRPEIKAKLLETATAFNKADPYRYALAMKAGQANLRAKELGLEGRLSLSDIKELRASGSFVCHWCGEALSDEKGRGTRWEVDHLRPMSKGGPNELSNLVKSDRKCNSSKKDKLPEDFLAEIAA